MDRWPPNLEERGGSCESLQDLVAWKPITRLTNDLSSSQVSSSPRINVCVIGVNLEASNLMSLAR